MQAFALAVFAGTFNFYYGRKNSIKTERRQNILGRR
jgi:hypothetical protein